MTDEERKAAFMVYLKEHAPELERVVDGERGGYFLGPEPIVDGRANTPETLLREVLADRPNRFAAECWFCGIGYSTPLEHHPETCWLRRAMEVLGDE